MFKLRFIVSLLLTVITLAGCAGTAAFVALNPDAKRIEIGRHEAGKGYREIGPISVSHGEGCGGFGAKGTYESAYNLLKNEAGRMGADYVQIIHVVEPHPDANCFVANQYTLRAIVFAKK